MCRFHFHRMTSTWKANLFQTIACASRNKKNKNSWMYEHIYVDWITWVRKTLWSKCDVAIARDCKETRKCIQRDGKVRKQQISINRRFWVNENLGKYVSGYYPPRNWVRKLEKGPSIQFARFCPSTFKLLLYKVGAKQRKPAVFQNLYNFIS